MRSIGRKNIEMIKMETERSMRETGCCNVEDLVVSRLDEKLWDTWEGADSQIRQTIFDTILNTRVNRVPEYMKGR